MTPEEFKESIKGLRDEKFSEFRKALKENANKNEKPPKKK